MSTELATRSNGATQDSNIIEAVIAKGDLAKLTPDERVNYYTAVCRSVGLNPLTRPFEYINLSGKLTLYARKDATDQMRSLNGVSLSIAQIDYAEDLVIVTVNATTRGGRTDSDVGAVSIASLKGEARANAVMKAITKAKRRVTLSICGLGWLDESEIEGIATPVVVDSSTGEILNGNGRASQPAPQPWQTWKSANDAIVWAVGAWQDATGYEADDDNLRGLYDELKTRTKPKNAAAMFEAWQKDVLEAVSEFKQKTDEGAAPSLLDDPGVMATFK